MQVDDKTLLDKFTINFVKVLEKHAKYIIVSGFVAIAHGRIRGTEDIDIIIERIPEDKFEVLHKELIEKGFECIQPGEGREIYKDYLLENSSIRYVKKGTLVPQMELKLAKDEIDKYQLATRKKLPLTGLDLYFSSIEMNIAFKEEYLKSQKDIDDAKHLRIVYEDKISEDEIRKIKKDIRRLRL